MQDSTFSDSLFDNIDVGAYYLDHSENFFGELINVMQLFVERY